jgi:hypothetical protein
LRRREPFSMLFVLLVGGRYVLQLYRGTFITYSLEIACLGVENNRTKTVQSNR